MNRKLTTFFAVLLAIAFMTSACTTQQDTTPTQDNIIEQPTDTPVPPSQDIVNETDEEGNVTIIDVLGNEIAAPEAAPVRIVSLSAANTEMLFALGLGEYVVGVDAYSNYPPEALDIEKVGDFNGPNVEAIIALNPDLVLAGNKLQYEAVSQLIDLGVCVAAVEATRYEEVYASIKLVGDLTMTTETAQELIDGMRLEEEAILQKVQAYEGETLSVYYVMSAGEFGNWTAGPGSFIDDMLKMLNVKTITDLDVTAPWMDFSLETLVAEDPDILIVVQSDYLNAQMLSDMDTYKELTAVKEGRAYDVNEDILSRASVRVVQALDLLYKAIYEN